MNGTPLPMTLTQKILTHHARGLARPWIQAGDVVQVAVDWTLASELAWNGMEQTYQALGRPPLFDPRRFYLAIDHTVDPVTLAHDPRARALTERARRFAQEGRVRHFYDANETIMHTKFYRELLQPGQLVLGADSHTSSHGGLGAFAIGLGGADVTAAMVLGQTWLEVPRAIAVEYHGELPFGLSGKDVILRTLGLLGRNTVAMEKTVEYRGPAVQQLSLDARFAIANMTAEFGGLNGIFEPDVQVEAWLGDRTEENAAALYFRADEGAPYDATHRIDLDGLVPQVAKPFSPDNVVSARELEGLALDGLFIGACTTTEEELVLAALVLEEAMRGRRPLPPSPKKLVVPGDRNIEGRLRERGLWQAYELAGFRIGPPGCSMCLGIASEKAGRGEAWLSSQNRNYENRMGPGSLAHLASAATVAASAPEQRLQDPSALIARIDRDRYTRLLGRPVAAASLSAEWASPSPELGGGVGTSERRDAGDGGVRGRVQRFGDHVDTDAIIPGEFCHLTDRGELGEKAFFHVRPEFTARARAGRSVVVAGEAWGSGSSREQAVWALLGAGVKAVVAKSFAFIHKRNLVNEALLCWVIRDERFHQLAVEDAELELDVARRSVRHVASGETFAAEPTGAISTALWGEGGLVPAVQRHGKELFRALGLS